MEAYKIWEEKFGSYSQDFSKWICDKLREERLLNMNVEEKKQYFKDREKELKKERKLLKMEKKEMEDNQKKATEFSQKKMEKEKQDKLKLRQECIDLAVKRHKKPQEWAEKVFKLYWVGQYLRGKRPDLNNFILQKYGMSINFLKMLIQREIKND